jgi:hypothetical protein
MDTISDKVQKKLHGGAEREKIGVKRGIVLNIKKKLVTSVNCTTYIVN